MSDLDYVEKKQKAFEDGDIEAACSLGDHYTQMALNGDAEENTLLAIQWYEKAALCGDGYAQYRLAECYYNRQSVDDKMLAVVWYNIFIKNKSFGSSNSVARKKIRELTKEYNFSDEEIELAIKQAKAKKPKSKPNKSNSSATSTPLNISPEDIYYESREHLNKGNYLKARQGFLKAVELLNSNAMADLGYMYYNGLGTQKNEKKAVDYFIRALCFGNETAKNNLETIQKKEFSLSVDERQKISDEAQLDFDINLEELKTKAKSNVSRALGGVEKARVFLNNFFAGEKDASSELFYKAVLTSGIKRAMAKEQILNPIKEYCKKVYELVVKRITLVFENGMSMENILNIIEQTDIKGILRALKTVGLLDALNDN